mgnify:CR=1 FL=1
MDKKTTGILFVVASALIYGFTPILARSAFDGGANGITVTFLRGTLSIPLLFLALKLNRIPLALGKDWKTILPAGIFGMALSTLLLYISYNYISVGMATTLHFTYPIVVTTTCVVLFKDKLTHWKILALVLCTLGIFMFIDKISATGATGVILALSTGIAYSFYLILIDKSGLKNMHYFKLTFYLNLIIAIESGLLGIYTGNLNLSLTPKAWILCALVSLFTSFGALPLLQQGVKLTGASTAAILSTLEPITSVILGILILRETVSPLKLVGCVLIIASILLIAISEKKTDSSKQSLSKPEPTGI